MPHPLDMIAERNESDEEQINLRDYFPENNQIDNAYYWRKFGGKLELTTDFTEHLCRPSDVINALIRQGFRIEGMWEPRGDNGELAPCHYRAPEPWLTKCLAPARAAGSDHQVDLSITNLHPWNFHEGGEIDVRK